MIYLLRLFVLLIQIDQETILNWLGLTNTENQIFSYEDEINNSFSNFNIEPSTDVSIETLKLIIEGLWNKLQNGLTLSEIESILFFILFVRFVILAIKYNLKTSFYIVCIGLASGYLWYRHLIDVMMLYREVLLKIPFFHRLGIDAFNLRDFNRQAVRNDVILGENVHWYDIGQLIYYAFTKGIVDVDPRTNLRSYIDPISMLVANLDEPLKSNVVPYYYKVYNKIIPQIFGICSRFWTQLSGLAAYALITRIGKRYCPYAVRWHWTVLLILGFPEQIIVFLVNRMVYFQSAVLIPKAMLSQQVDLSLLFEINFLNAMFSVMAVMHMSFVILGLLHAISGQYMYIPFFVENAELHIGPRPKNSVYSGGYTSWQDPEEKAKSLNSIFPRFWYGWLGKRRTRSWRPFQFMINYLKKLINSGLKK